MKAHKYCSIFLFLLFLFPNFIVANSCIFSINAQINETEEKPIIGFSTNILLSIDDSHYAHHVEVSMAISDDGVLFAGWKNSETHYGGGARVSIVRSLDGGSSWSHPYDMPMYEGHFTRQSDPWLYWYNNTLYYAYLEFENEYFNNQNGGYLTQMTVAKSMDDGISWIPVKATNNSFFADKETIVVGESNAIFLAYDDVNIEDEYGNATVRVTRSLDGGDSYEELSIIGEDEYFIGPYITLNASGDPYVAWSWIPPSGGNIFFSKSSDKGLTFEKPKMINSDGNYTAIESPGKTTLPLLKFDPFNRLYLIWADKFDQIYNTWDVYLRYSDDLGDTWSERLRVNPSVQGNQWNPDMVFDEDGKLHMVYYHEISGYYRPYYRILQFNGTLRDTPVFSDQVVIADAFTPSSFIRPGEYFAIQLDNNSIPHVVWSDGRNNELDIYYAKGLTILPLFTPEIITIIIAVSIIALASLTILYYYIRVRGISKPERIKKQQLKLFKKTYGYFCENCHSFSMVSYYCENCGSSDYIRKAIKTDYMEHFKGSQEKSF